jgi:hypothetical protein
MHRSAISTGKKGHETVQSSIKTVQVHEQITVQLRLYSAGEEPLLLQSRRSEPQAA